MVRRPNNAQQTQPFRVSAVRVKFREHFKKIAPGEDRTHGLQIMRLTRCLLRYQGIVITEQIAISTTR